MKTFAERLRALRGSKNQATFSDEIGISQRSLSRYETGENSPDVETVQRICVVLKIDPRWLISGDGPMRRPDESVRVVGDNPLETHAASDTEIVLIPMTDAVLSAGHGSFEVSDESERKYAFRGDFLRRKGNPSRMVLMRVDGDSMEPSIKSGDVVLIDQSQTTLRPGKFYAVGVEDMIFIKLVSAEPGKVILRSLNDAYKPLEIDTREDLQESVRIVGRCVWSCREL